MLLKGECQKMYNIEELLKDVFQTPWPSKPTLKWEFLEAEEVCLLGKLMDKAS
jgi:hypothetical protein